jgi:exonuclease SbcC
MRPHHLRLTAFGPFAGTVEADLDALAAGGLFLLQGPTGAGKTTLLDAICFALFGSVPGRRDIRRLRSDHAEAGVRCAVSLDVTLAGRRLRVTRTAAHERPKKRGTGTATEPGSLRVEELAGGDWRTWSTRPDEAGDLLADLVGMSAEQFTQVVLLPQGAFATFLHAGAAERGALLERLFGTDRFAGVEDWLAERRTDLADRVARGSRGVLTIAAGVAQEAGVEVPEHPDVAWYDATCADLDAQRLLVEADTVAAASAAAAAEAAHQGELARAEMQRRRAEALGALAALTDGADAAAAGRRRLHAARAAAPLLPLLQRADRSAAATRTDAGDPAALRQAADLARLRFGGLEALLPQAERLADLGVAASESTARRVAADRQVADLEAEEQDLPALLAAAAAAREDAAAAARALPSASALAGRLGDLVVDAARRQELDRLLRAARAVETAARIRSIDARETRLAVREALVHGQAGRLAALLRTGEACTVCGATEHPRPALVDAPLPSESEVAAVESGAEAAQTALAAAGAVVAGLSAERQVVAARLEAAGWAEIDGLAAARTAADADLRAREAGAALLPAAVAADDLVRSRSAVLGAELAAARERRSSAAQRETGSLAEALAGRAALTAALGDAPDLSTALQSAADEIAALDAAAVAAVEAHRLAGDAADAATELRDAIAASELPDLAALRAATLPAAAVEALSEQLAAYDAQLAAARAIPELALPDGPVADVGTTGALAAERGAERDRLAEATAIARDRHARVVRLGPEFRSRAAALAPLQAEHTEAAALADLARGGNTYGMRLSTYVLAARLEQVAAAASQRLLLMTDGRYALRHTDIRADKRTRGGLGLLVQDGWTGGERDTGTLSGGETFAASLALALGLADVVTAEAGGAPIDALFVDEGFGSLDEDTLEEVMDVLDGLRSGGRVVGIVSHVPDLRRRIPAQLQVRKTRAGSTLELTVA